MRRAVLGVIALSATRVYSRTRGRVAQPQRSAEIPLRATLGDAAVLEPFDQDPGIPLQRSDPNADGFTSFTAGVKTVDMVLSFFCSGSLFTFGAGQTGANNYMGLLTAIST